MSGQITKKRKRKRLVKEWREHNYSGTWLWTKPGKRYSKNRR